MRLSLYKAQFLANFSQLADLSGDTQFSKKQKQNKEERSQWVYLGTEYILLS